MPAGTKQGIIGLVKLRKRSFEKLALCSAAALFVVVSLTFSSPLSAQAADGVQKRGRVTNLAIPRFVSFKAGSVNLRVGPGRKYAISWLYKKRGLPVEVIQEFDRWRRVRDAEGTTGWVLHSLLSARRTALIAPWDREADENGKVVRASFHDGKYSAGSDAAISAKLQSGLLVDIKSCADNWCEVDASGTSAWIPQDKLWGAYPREVIED